jgi:molybdenum cofactor synthesis domain-containing protein
VISAAVLNIGTELTTGQILNRNAHWISNQLKKEGLLCNLQLTVPDSFQLILDALNYAVKSNKLIFITGGLGPTSDDFTREVLLKWTGLESFFDEASWQHVQHRLTSRGFTVRDFQKQQCYFPVGSKILFNRAGTANAFTFNFNGISIYVLPGPPGEIEAVWNDHLLEPMKQLSEKNDATLTHSWDCLGQGESEIAHLTEKVTANTELEVGYRVHVPYVEVKLSFRRSAAEKAAPIIANLENALRPYTVLRNGEDVAELICNELQRIGRTVIIDQLNGHYLAKRLFPFANKLYRQGILNLQSFAEGNKFPEDTNHLNYSDNDDVKLIISLMWEGADFARCTLFWPQQNINRTQFFGSEYNRHNMLERKTQHMTELALLWTLQQLRS